MSSLHVVIVYGTRFGQTAKIAERMKDVLTGEGHAVTLVRADALAPDFSLAVCDGAIVGASVIAGHHQRYVERFVQEFRHELNRMPSAFFSVSGSAAGSSERDHANAQHVLEAFLTKTGWYPSMTATIAGAMAYTKYGFFTRLMLKRISRRAGGPTDTSRDHELTNWEQVEQFAAQFAASLPAPVEVGSAQR